ncbi:MAG TPA: GDP-mannose 4,6-dehydratase [Acidobacteriota bacterium]|nr:GDP-mannose 4,6-dehydratase [Acidobacteriota bacterium]
MRAFITGAGGFAGRYLTDSLRRHGWEVSGLASRTKALDDDIPAGDVLDFRRLLELIGRAHPDAVFHLAAASNPSKSLQDPLPHYQINALGTATLLEALRRQAPRARTLIVSTGHVYRPADVEGGLDEDSPLHPSSPYAASKRAAEIAALQYAGTYGLPVMIARSFNHAGPGQSSHYVVAQFCAQAAALERVDPSTEAAMEVGNLNPIRDFLDVRDVVEAYRLLVERGEPGQIYNVASGQGTAIKDLLSMVLEEIGRPVTVHSRQERQRSGEASVLVGNPEKLRRATDWRPARALNQTIQETLDEWRQRQSGA